MAYLGGVLAAWADESVVALAHRTLVRFDAPSGMEALGTGHL